MSGGRGRREFGASWPRELGRTWTHAHERELVNESEQVAEEAVEEALVAGREEVDLGREDGEHANEQADAAGPGHLGEVSVRDLGWGTDGLRGDESLRDRKRRGQPLRAAGRVCERRGAP